MDFNQKLFPFHLVNWHTANNLKKKGSLTLKCKLLNPVKPDCKKDEKKHGIPLVTITHIMGGRTGYSYAD